MIEKPAMGLADTARRRDLVELRVANLRRELGAETEPRLQAAILYQLGSLYEHELEQTSEAMEEYRRAQQIAPGFQPALIAQLRIAERSENSYDLGTLRSQQVARATSPAVSSAALVDLAMHSEDWASLLREAIARSPEPAIPALILEWLAEARGDDSAVRDALLAQAKHARDPNLRAALWLDLALHEIDSGRPDEAIEALDRVCESDALVWQARSLQSRTARDHGRWEAFVLTVTSMARLLEAAVERNDAQDPLSLPVPEEERLPLATFLWHQAATCSATHLDDLEAAAGYLDSALRLLPNRRLTRLQALLIAERRGDLAAAQAPSAWFRANAPDDAAFVSHELRLALSSDDVHGAFETLRDVARRFPDSDYVRAALEVASIRSASHRERAESLVDQAQSAEGEARARLNWRAAQLSSADPDSSERAQALYSAAIAASSGSGHSRTAMVREALGAAMRTKQWDAVVGRCDELMQGDIDPTERAMLAYSKYDLTRHAQGAEDEAQQLLAEALSDSRNRAWAPQLARAQAAWTGDARLLAQAHEASAELESGDRRLGHLCAAGWAYARNCEWEAAKRVLRLAMDAAPDDQLVLSQLDAVLREGGRPEEVVSLARERAQSDSKAALGELSLLLAGASAERSGNLTAARHAYEQALVEAPGSPSAALAMLDIARLQGDSQATLRAYAALSRSELGGGVPELYALLEGDAQSAVNGVGAGLAYGRALEHASTAPAAAIALLSLPLASSDADQRLTAEELLVDAGSFTAEDQTGFASAYRALRASLGEQGASAGEAWLGLSAAAPNDALRAAALLQGLRATGLARGTDAADELFMLAQEAKELSDLHTDASIAIDEALAPGDDAALRVQALERKLQHSAALGRSALDAAHCRALVEADRGAEAVALLSEAVDERPDDLALWETLRSAARQAGEWPLVALACERLAPYVDGSLSGDLLEEAGVVRMDRLQQYRQAEDLFRRALEVDPARDIAFRRLRDLLVAHEDAEALEALVSERLALGGPKERRDLLYERARLLRGFSDRPGALEVLGELFDAEPDHAGALALAAEVHVSLEHWAEAVDCLRLLSRASIPEEQRRLAHLGAADFLESKLGAKDEALGELRAVEALGLADAETWTRIAALEVALDRPGAAIDAYKRALEAEPTQQIAIASLVDLLDDAETDAAVASYEAAIWARVEAGELDASLLEALGTAATWRGHDARASATFAVQGALGLAPAGGVQHTDLDRVSAAALWDKEADPVLQEVVLRAGPALGHRRLRSTKASPSEPIFAELERLSQRFGIRTGSVGVSTQLATPVAQIGSEGEIRWVVPQSARAGLDAMSRFMAGRLAWAAARGGAQLVDGSAEQAAGLLLAVLRVSGCEVTAGDPPLPGAEIKLRRAVRKEVHKAAGRAKLSRSSLLAYARSLQRSADRAGLLASGDIATGLAVLLSGRLSVEALKTSPRALNLLRFWLDASSPLWVSHD
jgi:hypothetical protein